MLDHLEGTVGNFHPVPIPIFYFSSVVEGEFKHLFFFLEGGTPFAVGLNFHRIFHYEISSLGLKSSQLTE